VGERVLRLPGEHRAGEAAHCVPGRVQRAERDLDVGQNHWIDALGGGVDHRAPARRRRPREADDPVRQLEGPAGLRVPRLHEDERARPRHGQQLRRRSRVSEDRRLGRHGAGRRGEPVRRTGEASLVLRPLGRSRELGRQLRHHERGHRRRRRRRLPHPEHLGVLRLTARHRSPGVRLHTADDRPQQGDPLRRARPLVHELAALSAVLHGQPPAEPGGLRREHGRGVEPGRRLGGVHQAGTVPPGGEGASLGVRVDRYRRLRGHRLQGAIRPSVARRTSSSSRRATTGRSSTARPRPTTRRGS
jgi:hypothetical protein